MITRPALRPAPAAGLEAAQEALLYIDFAALLELAAHDERTRCAVWAACWRDRQAWAALQSLAHAVAEQQCTAAPLEPDIEAYWDALCPTPHSAPPARVEAEAAA